MYANIKARLQHPSLVKASNNDSHPTNAFTFVSQTATDVPGESYTVGDPLPQADSGQNQLSNSVIAGIIIGVIVSGTILFVAVVYFLYRRHKTKQGPVAVALIESPVHKDPPAPVASASFQEPPVVLKVPGLSELPEHCGNEERAMRDEVDRRIKEEEHGRRRQEQYRRSREAAEERRVRSSWFVDETQAAPTGEEVAGPSPVNPLQRLLGVVNGAMGLLPFSDNAPRVDESLNRETSTVDHVPRVTIETEREPGPHAHRGRSYPTRPGYMPVETRPNTLVPVADRAPGVRESLGRAPHTRNRPPAVMIATERGPLPRGHRGPNLATRRTLIGGPATPHRNTLLGSSDQSQSPRQDPSPRRHPRFSDFLGPAAPHRNTLLGSSGQSQSPRQDPSPRRHPRFSDFLGPAV